MDFTTSSTRRGSPKAGNLVQHLHVPSDILLLSLGTFFVGKIEGEVLAQGLRFLHFQLPLNKKRTQYNMPQTLKTNGRSDVQF